MEGDPLWSRCSKNLFYFNPLPPCGGRLPPSILFDVSNHFNPLPPCGGRPRSLKPPEYTDTFQSTPSVWRETLGHICQRRTRRISIHSLRVEGDEGLSAVERRFYISIHSLRVEGDHGSVPAPKKSSQISIHSLRVEGDSPADAAAVKMRISIHSLRVEGDLCSYVACLARYKFQSTPSVWRETG